MTGWHNETSEGIYQEAAEWLLLREDRPLSPRARIRYERWLTRPFRREAMDRVRQCSERITVLRNAGYRFEPHTSPS